MSWLRSASLVSPFPIPFESDADVSNVQRRITCGRILEENRSVFCLIRIDFACLAVGFGVDTTLTMEPRALLNPFSFGLRMLTSPKSLYFLRLLWSGSYSPCLGLEVGRLGRVGLRCKATPAASICPYGSCSLRRNKLDHSLIVPLISVPHLDQSTMAFSKPYTLPAKARSPTGQVHLLLRR